MAKSTQPGSPRPTPRPGDVIHNPVHGETIRFLHTGGDDDPTLRGELTVGPQASGPPPHIHPNSSEQFKVISGAVRLKSGREDRVVVAGEVATVQPGVRHSFHNHTDEPAVVLVRFEPGLDMARFLDKWFELARNGQLNSKGRSGVLQTAVLFDAYLDSIALPGLPLGLQRLLFRGLSGLARRRGYT